MIASLLAALFVAGPLQPIPLHPRIASAGVQAGSPRAPASLTGTVHDSTGASIAGASVVVRDANGIERRTVTDTDGRFTVEMPAGAALVLIVRAQGFAESRQSVGSASAIDVTLAPARLLEAVTVTASRGLAGTEVPAATSVIDAATLESTPAAMLDDRLKSVPGFSLFRRSSSRVANPTTQGVTMRGLSASGASRSLVLVDGIPLNDAFGGWIYWDRVPQTALDRVEIVRGGTSDLYGADAVGGVIQLFTLSPAGPTVRGSAEIGSHSTPRLSLFGGGARKGWSGFASGEWQRTDGYIIVARQPNPAAPNASFRGPVDIAASSRYRTAYGNLGYQAGTWRAVVRGSYFTEARGNGTPLTNNDTNSRAVVVELTGPAGGGFWLVRAYGGTQRYNQSFSSVTTTSSLRASESLTQRQRVPSRNAGASAQWTMPAGRVAWTAGGDLRRTRGTSDGTTYTRNVATGFASNGGVQWQTGAFGRVEVAARGDLTLVGSLRADRWSSDPTNPAASAQDATEVSPKAAVTWRAADGLVVHGVVTHAFRAPSLNELFRNFRAGGSATTANNALTPEKLAGVEGGVSLARGPAELRVVGFWSHLVDAVTNVTVTTTPTLITRQRRNAGTIRAAGFEVEGDWQIVPAVRASAGAQFVSSIFAASQEPGLAGNRVPQVPRASVAASIRVAAPGAISAVGQLRSASSQFDDDRNTLPLHGATVFDAYAARAFGHGVQLFGAVENLFDAEYRVGNTPLITTGLPRTFRAGVRLALP